jgi:hypothetical protein
VIFFKQHAMNSNFMSRRMFEREFTDLNSFPYPRFLFFQKTASITTPAAMSPSDIPTIRMLDRPEDMLPKRQGFSPDHEFSSKQSINQKPPRSAFIERNEIHFLRIAHQYWKPVLISLDLCNR